MFVSIRCLHLRRARAGDCDLAEFLADACSVLRLRHGMDPHCRLVGKGAVFNESHGRPNRREAKGDQTEGKEKHEKPRERLDFWGLGVVLLQRRPGFRGACAGHPPDSRGTGAWPITRWGYETTPEK